MLNIMINTVITKKMSPHAPNKSPKHVRYAYKRETRSRFDRLQPYRNATAACRPSVLGKLCKELKKMTGNGPHHENDG
jgi:hypothetical protein